MDPDRICILFPHRKISLHRNDFHAIQRHHVKFTYGTVVFRRISGSHYDPSSGDRLISERFSLQELEHRRRQRLGDTVDLIVDALSLLIYFRFATMLLGI